MWKGAALGLFSLGVVSWPIYVLRSGVPQLSDIMLLSAALMMMVSGVSGWWRRNSGPMSLLVAFAAWTFLVGITWSLVGQNPSVAIFGLYYAFDAMVFAGGLMLFEEFGLRFVSAFRRAIALSVLVAAAAMILTWSPNSLRQSGTFNNPNQLGYFAVVSAAVLIESTRVLPVRRKLFIAIAGVSAILAMLSWSRAALVGGLAWLGLSLAARLPIRVLVMAGFIALLGLSVIGLVRPSLDWQSATRFQSLNSALAERGYDRIWRNPQYLLLGAGEGRAIERGFLSTQASELHSTWGTLVFAYGFVGTLLFFAFLRSVSFRWTAFSWIAFVPAVLYGFTHQGMRSTDFWLLILFLRVLSEIPGLRQSRLRLTEVAWDQGPFLHDAGHNPGGAR